jgi:hypothetical protein
MKAHRILLASASLLTLAGHGALAADGTLSPVAAVPKTDGVAAPNVLATGLIEVPAAVGTMPIENASPAFPFYGFAGDGSMLPAPGAVQQKDMHVEATKTEPDKNTYLVLTDAAGPTAGYAYGSRFVFQGHELGPKDADGNMLGVLTRINLDADAAHRVTLMAEKDVAGKPLPTIDGSTWNPFAKRILLTAELGPKGGVWQATSDFPSKVEPLLGIFGQAGYEGIQTDPNGTIWLIEDSGGTKGKTNAHARQPNSFVFRFVPKDKADLTKGGKLQALQIVASNGQPITFHKDDVDGDIMSKGMKELHSYGVTLKTAWVVLHDTDTEGTEPFDANALAKEKQATPLKRPENGQFRPGTGFKEFVFDETGDTDTRTEAGSEYGGFSAVLKLVQADPAADEGTISLIYRGDAEHTGLDNIAFWSADKVVVVEDASDALHSQRKAFDSAYVLDLTADYSKAGVQPVRLFAIGRDPLATIDSAIGGSGAEGFQNDGDNEITGIHVSDGDATEAGLLGAKVPTPFRDGWRVFYTQQHGENTTWEVLSPAETATN